MSYITIIVMYLSDAQRRVTDEMEWDMVESKKKKELERQIRRAGPKVRTSDREVHAKHSNQQPTS